MDRAGKRLRPVDLARAAGISTQQVRNYEEAGALPAAPRTPSGYRSYDARHRNALLTYRALVRGYGTDTALAIMRAVHAGDIPQTLTLIDAGHAALHEQRLSLEATQNALEVVAEENPDSSAPGRSGMRIGEVAAYLGIRASALRVWESAGLLAPRREHGTRYRSFDPADIRDARIIHMLRQSGYLLPQIRSVLDGLRHTGNTDALRAAIEQRQKQLIQRSTAMLEGASLLHRYITGEQISGADAGGAGG
ncbi:MerR family transcriptional regulator [Actinobacteria bacterium YIM 96077]|uniref:MerR family transcriptional regulator n=1 Tax=Phytoactinopolyspora halophila TaxID=1981511 RepID=A0A329QCC6_9ACTN|nr:MerR family transcriptional regulator [Actinobacteria bacterium YIM 96077]RAW09399.1 MerR family transcriptional regulator [Phytoactinopolyspora halophila]